MRVKLSVVIVHWNTPDLLKKQLTVLRQDLSIQCIVVDNNSTKKPEKIDGVTYISNTLNRGYASACNQGFLKAEASWVLFLNPDVLIEPADLLTMVKEAERRGYDACSPEPSNAGYQKPLPSVLSLLAEFTLLRFLIPLHTFRTHTLFGGALLIRREVLEKLGGWDERFFVWFEDADLTRRLLSNHRRIGWIKVPLSHDGGASFHTLTKEDSRDLFFHAMRTYAHKHFSYMGRKIIDVLSKRYTSKKLPLARAVGVSMTIPNMHLSLLETFLSQNQNILDTLDEVIIVSSAPQNRLWKFRIKYPFYIFIPLAKNRGFAHTVNIGLRRSTMSYTGTVNDDTVLQPSFFQQAPAYFQKHPNTGSVNPVIKKPDGTIESAGIHILKKGKAIPITDAPTQIDATNAACVIYNREALQKTGLFDEHFGSYLEDIDLSLSLSKKGYINTVLSNAHITHLGQQSSKDLGAYKNYLDAKNWVMLIAKHWSFPDLLFNGGAILVERLRNISGILKAYFAQKD